MFLMSCVCEYVCGVCVCEYVCGVCVCVYVRKCLYVYHSHVCTMVSIQSHVCTMVFIIAMVAAMCAL